MTDSAPIRGAVSSLSAALVHGPVREARVAARTRLGVYLLLETGGDFRASEVLPVVTSDALALPTAVRLPVISATFEWPLEQGETVSVGGGLVAASGLRVQAVRTVRPARVRRAPQPWTGRRDAAGCAPHTPSSLTRLIARLGSGPGLTPETDDELAGHLLVRWALGRHVPDLEGRLHRTTALSASLLRAAAQGYAVPEVVGYVDAVVRGDRDGALRLRSRVEGIGHTSGPALLRGIDAAHARHHDHHDHHDLDRHDLITHPSVERTVA